MHIRLSRDVYICRWLVRVYVSLLVLVFSGCSVIEARQQRRQEYMLNIKQKETLIAAQEQWVVLLTLLTEKTKKVNPEHITVLTMPNYPTSQDHDVKKDNIPEELKDIVGPLSDLGKALLPVMLGAGVLK